MLEYVKYYDQLLDAFSDKLLALYKRNNFFKILYLITLFFNKIKL